MEGPKRLQVKVQQGRVSGWQRPARKVACGTGRSAHLQAAAPGGAAASCRAPQARMVAQGAAILSRQAGRKALSDAPSGPAPCKQQSALGLC